MENYEYTPTEAKWINKIPSHWECKKIGNIFTQRNEKVSDKVYEPLSVSKNGVVPQLESAVKTDAGDNRKLVLKGDFVINSRSDRKGSCGVSPLDGSVSLINIVLKPRQSWNEKYVHYLMRCHLFSEEYYRNGRGIVADLWTTRYSEMKSILLPVPPCKEQDQIVRYLDWQTSKINRLIAAKKQQIELLDEYERSIIRHFVTNGVSDDVLMQNSTINWMSSVPAHWEILFLSQVAEEQSISNRGMTETNLLSLSYGKIVKKDINTTEGLLPANFGGYQIINKDNIILRLTDLQNDHRSLRIGISTQRGIITSAYTCLSVKNNILPKFLYLQLHLADLCKVFYGMGGGVRQSISYKDIRRMLIAVPPINEQQEIVDRIDRMCSELKPYVNTIQTQIKHLEELRTRLISDVVTGQIDVRSIKVPDFELVEEMMDDADIAEDVNVEEEE